MKQPGFNTKSNLFIALSIFTALAVIISLLFYEPIVFYDESMFSLDITKFLLYILGCTGIVFAIIGMIYKQKTRFSWAVIMLGIVGISFNGIGLFSVTTYPIRPLITLTGTIASIRPSYDRRYIITLTKGYVPLNTSLDPECSTVDVYVNADFNSNVFKQYGNSSWQKWQVGISALQVGQHIQVISEGWDWGVGRLDPIGNCYSLDQISASETIILMADQ